MQTAFCSYPYELTVINLSSQEKTEFTLSYERECIESVTFLNDLLLVRAKTACGNHRFAVGIKIETEGMAYIPKDNKTEVLCYEFKGKFNNKTYLVYINAKTGNEERILILVESGEGTLTI